MEAVTLIYLMNLAAEHASREDETIRIFIVSDTDDKRDGHEDKREKGTRKLLGLTLTVAVSLSIHQDMG